MIEAIVAIILLLGLGSSSDEPPKQVAPEIEVGVIRLQVPFTILEGGTLVIGEDPRIGGFPKKLGEVLQLVLPSETVRIDTIAQLRGRVEISSPEEALAFCRLITSPRTFHLYWHSLGGPRCQDRQRAVVKMHCASLGRAGEGWLLCPPLPPEGSSRAQRLRIDLPGRTVIQGLVQVPVIVELKVSGQPLVSHFCCPVFGVHYTSSRASEIGRGVDGSATGMHDS